MVLLFEIKTRKMLSYKSVDKYNYHKIFFEKVCFVCTLKKTKTNF